MPFYTKDSLEKLGFKKIGKNVKISTHAQIYKPELMEIGDYVRIDDHCILSGKITINNFVHIAAKSLIDGATEGVYFEDFSGVAYNCIVISASDSYRLAGYYGPFCLPEFRRNFISKKVIIGKYSVLGSFCTVLPGVTIAEGCSFGAYTLVSKSTQSWSFYMGQPAIKLRDNEKGIIEMAEKNAEQVIKRGHFTVN